MSDKQQKWLYVVLVIIVPFILVHIFVHSPIPRLISIVWLFTIFPVLCFIFVFDRNQTVLADTSKLRRAADPRTLQKWNIAVKSVAFLAAVAWLGYFTLPILFATYNVYVRKTPLTTIESTVTGLSSTVFTPGLYLYVTLSNDSSTGFMYWLPTVYSFGDAHYIVTILTGTDIILQVEPE